MYNLQYDRSKNVFDRFYFQHIILLKLLENGYCTIQKKIE